MTEEIDSKSNLRNNYEQFKIEPNVYEMKILSVTESQNSDKLVDIESLETAKSSQNVDVQIKEEPGTYDSRGHYSWNVTEDKVQSPDYKIGNSVEKDLQAHKEASLVRHGTDYAVCIKYEPMPCDVSNPYLNPGTCSTTDLGKPYDQSNDKDGTPGSSQYYKTSGDVFNRDVQVSCGPIKCEIHEPNIQKPSTEQRVANTCYNIDNSVNTDDIRASNRTCYEVIYGPNCSVDIPKRTRIDQKQYDSCSFSSVATSGLVALKKRHVGIDEKRLKCDVCSYTTIPASHVVVHKR